MRIARVACPRVCLRATDAHLPGVELLPVIREAVAELGAEDAWIDSVNMIITTSAMDAEESELRLAEALGWKVWAACNKPKYLKPKLPNTSKLATAMAWLSENSVGFSQDQLQTAIRKSPKTYLGDPGVKYSAALEAAPAEFKTPQDFNALLMKSPEALELTHNCETTGCAAQCGNCWRVALPKYLGKPKETKYNRSKPRGPRPSE